MDNITLKSIFELNKDELSKKLRGLTLPKDSQKIQTIVSDFLGNLFENDGMYRQSLTDQEDFILLAAIELIKSQQNITSELTKNYNYTSQSNANNTKEQKSELRKKNLVKDSVIAGGAGLGALAGSGLGVKMVNSGALSGGLVSTWFAFAGAIAVSALVIYLSYQKENNRTKTFITKNCVVELSLDTEVFCSIVERICESIDNVIETYRVQVKRIINTYEQREKPTLLNTYSLLTEQIATVINISRNCGEDTPEKLKNAILIMEECLENYDLKFENGKIRNI